VNNNRITSEYKVKGMCKGNIQGHVLITECCYKTVNCEQLMYCIIPEFMHFGLLHSTE